MTVDKKKLTVAFWGVTFGALLSLPVQAQSYGYVNPINERHTISLQMFPPIFAGGDRAIDAEFCNPSSGYICVSSTDFSFAFPIKKTLGLTKWEYKDHIYELIGQERLQVLGTSLNVWIIESKQGIRKIRYAYSEQKGLLAFSIQLIDTTATFISIRTPGFGSTKRLKATQK